MVNTSICNDILRYGKIISDQSFIVDGANVRQYIIEYEGITYSLTKINGEWDYIHRFL